MPTWIRAAGQLASAVLTVLFLIADLQGFDELRRVNWRWWALVSFLIFVVLVYWSELERLLAARPSLRLSPTVWSGDRPQAAGVTILYLNVRNEPKKRTADAVARRVQARLSYFADSTTSLPKEMPVRWLAKESEWPPSEDFVDLDVNGAERSLMLLYLPKGNAFAYTAFDSRGRSTGFEVNKEVIRETKVLIWLTGEGIDEKWEIESVTEGMPVPRNLRKIS